MKLSVPTCIALAALLASCESPPAPSAYADHGAPESLINTSSEVVNVTLDTPSAIDDLIGWIDHDQPAQAELACVETDPACEKARDVLEQFKVPFTRKAPATPAAVVLHYQHTVMRDCDNRYIDNSKNAYNTNYSAWGCSVATNMAGQVGSTQPFLKPAASGKPDAEHAAQVYRDYENADTSQQNSDSAASSSSSLLSTLSGAVGGGSSR